MDTSRIEIGDPEASWRLFVDQIEQRFGCKLTEQSPASADVETVNAHIATILPDKTGPGEKTKQYFHTSLHCVQMFGQVAAKGASVVFGPAEVCFNATSLVIEAVQKASRAFDDLAVLMERMTAFLTTLESNLAKEVSGQASPGARKVCFEVLMHFLDVLGLVHEIASSKRKKIGFATKLVFTDKNPIQDALDRMEALIGDYTRTAVTDILATVSKDAREIGKVREGVEKLVDRQALQELKEALSLGFNDNIDANEKIHSDLTFDAIPGTGSWILDDGEFCTWADATNPTKPPVLCFSGARGSGKSFLSNRIARHLQTHSLSESGARTAVGIYYFPSAQGNDSWPKVDNKLLSRAFRSIAWQLAQVDGSFLKYMNEWCLSSVDLHAASTLWQALLDYSKESTTTFYVVFDGLMENAPDGQAFIENMVKDVSTDDASGPFLSRLRLLFSGRPRFYETGLDNILAPIDFARAKDRRNADDIARLIDHRLATSALPDDLRQRIKEIMIESLLQRNLFSSLDKVLGEIQNEHIISNIDTLLSQFRDGARQVVIKDVETRIAQLNSKLTDSQMDELNALLPWVVTLGSQYPPALALLEEVILLKNGGNSLGKLKDRIQDKYNPLLKIAKLRPRQPVMIHGDVDVEQYMASSRHPNRKPNVSGGTDRAGNSTTPGISVQEVENVRAALKTLCRPPLYDRFGFDDFFDSKLRHRERDPHHMPNHVHLYWNDSHVEIISRCLAAICDQPRSTQFPHLHTYATKRLPRHLESVDLDEMEVQTKQFIGLQMVQLFHERALMEAWWTKNRVEETKLRPLCRAVRKWWFDPDIAAAIQRYEGPKKLALFVVDEGQPEKVLVDAVLEVSRSAGATQGGAADSSGGSS